ncbi:unnamed protein product [Ambrosiozyma monospora]|uniref:Unnamed protein product n=1 Tax=Ambrosiozyma monospora TaxID=43982 RepID=A0ACB5TE57_AMBMO|nr:unnamed protein product [Ambrosiozyma monospora]
MAHDIPLTLYDCGFNEDEVKWSYGDGKENLHHLEFNGSWNDIQIKAITANFMKKAVYGPLKSNIDRVVVNLGDGRGSVSGKYIPIEKRPRLETPEQINAKWQMDQLLSKAGSTIVTFAIRSGVQIASSYVIKSVNQLMGSAPDKQKRALERLKSKLQTRIEIVSYAMELIQLVASRGNTNLESTLRLVNDLKLEIDEFEENIDDLAKEISTSKKLTPESIKSIQNYMQSLLVKIEQAIPVINLALTTSGANLSGSLNSYISPGRLLNTTVYINDSNLEFERTKKRVQVGPDFDLTFYNIFYNANRGSEITWREKFARCKLQIFRISVKEREYSYEVELTESFDDGRYHDDDDTPEKIILKVEDIARLFYSASA